MRGAADPETPPGATGLRRLAPRIPMLVLALVAYRALLPLGSALPFSREVETWLFLPSDRSTTAVLVLSLWLLHRRWKRLLLLPDRSAPYPLVAGILAAGAAIFAWAHYTRAYDLLVISLMANALGLGALWKGAAGLRLLLVPVGFLVFALPIPAPLLNHMVFPLQLATADCAGWLLHAMGVPVFVSGEQILRAEQQFAVIEGCSGLRSMETLTMIAVLLVDLFGRSGVHAAAVLAAAPAVAFALNGLRVIALILNPHSEVVAIHNLQGVAILLGGLVILYLLDGALDRLLARRGRTRGASREDSGEAGARIPSARARGAVLVGVLAATAALSVWMPAWRDPGPARLVLGRQIRPEIEGWRSAELRVDRAFLGRPGLRQIVYRRYRRGADEVRLFVGVGDRSQRFLSPFSPTTELPGSGWMIEERGTARLSPDGPVVRSLVVRSGGKRLLVFHWYQGTRGLADEILRSALALDSSPLRRAGDGVVVRISTDWGGPGPEARRAAERRLTRFFEILRVELGTLEAQLGRKRFSQNRKNRKTFSAKARGRSGEVAMKSVG